MPISSTCIALASLLAGAAAGPTGLAPEPQGAPAPAPAPGTATTPEAPGLDGHRLELLPAYQGTVLWSRSGSRYNLHSAALGLGWSAARDGSGPFAHLALLRPLQIRQDGRVYATSDLYSSRFGADLLGGWQWRGAPRSGFESELGAGLHAALVALAGRPGLASWSAAPLGLGVAYTLRTTARGASWHAGLQLGLTLDLYDPIRSNDLEVGLGWRAGLVGGFGGRSTP